MARGASQGVWIGPDGGARAVRLKGGPLFEAFHGIGDSLWSRTEHARDLSAARPDLARAYASVVWAYRCVKVRADALAGVPLRLLDRSGEPIDDHPLMDLLRDVNPNTMNMGDLLRATEAAYNIWGVAYWLKVRETRNVEVRRTSRTGKARLAPAGRSGKPSSRVRWLVWLNPQTVEPITDPVKGITGYKQTVGSQTRVYAPEDVIAFRNFNPLDDLGGLSPLSVALNEVNAELNAARFVAAFFSNDARPAGLLTSDQPLQEAELERTRTWWQKLFQGPNNRWKTGIVGGGLRWQTITFPPTDLALSDLRAEDRRAICAVFGVPASLAGAWEATTYATAREQKASFYEDTMIPQMEYIAEVLNWSLLPHYPDLTARGAYLAWDVDSIAALNETATDKAERLTRLFEAGIITRNEVRGGLGITLVDASEDGFVHDLAPKDGAPVNDPPGEPPPGADAGAGHALPLSERTNGNGNKSLHAELDRWERFALKRIKAGRSLRAFKSTLIPAELWWKVAIGLGKARSPDEVRAVFDEAIGKQRAAIRQTATAQTNT